MEQIDLSRIGLTDGESRVYLALLKMGSSTTGPIVDGAKVSRSKIYHILERLMDKGLVTTIKESNVRVFQACDPEKLFEYISSQEKKISDNRKYVSEVLPQLELFHKFEVREEAEIYRGLEGVKTARELVFKQLKRGETFYCFGANKMNLEALKAYFIEWHHLREGRGILARYLIQEDSRKFMGSSFPYSNSPLMKRRYLQTTGPVHIDIFGDYVVTCIMQGTFTSFLIKNKYVAKYYRDYFLEAWKIAKK